MNLNNNIIADFLQLNKKYVIGFFVLFYTVGFGGTVFSFTHSFFLKLFPWAIMLSFQAVLSFHDSRFDFKTLLLVLISAISGFFIEVAGINSHFIFGSYTYGETLGIKLFDTPLMIGINWAMLVFATGSIVEPLSVHVFIKVLLASALMVLYDFVIEFIAPTLGLWSFDGGTVPLKNYIAWFIIAVVLHSIYKILHVKTRSTIAFSVLACQAVFFILLIIFLR